jgi:Na+-driven multidrug efflux pump
MNGAVETFVSQSFGAKNLKLCGQYMNQGRIILLLMFIPIALILNQSDRILLAIK